MHMYIHTVYTRVRRWVTEPMQVPIIETQHSIDTCIYSVTHAHTLVLILVCTVYVLRDVYARYARVPVAKKSLPSH